MFCRGFGYYISPGINSIYPWHSPRIKSWHTTDRHHVTSQNTQKSISFGLDSSHVYDNTDSASKLNDNCFSSLLDDAQRLPPQSQSPPCPPILLFLQHHILLLDCLQPRLLLVECLFWKPLEYFVTIIMATNSWITATIIIFNVWQIFTVAKIGILIPHGGFSERKKLHLHPPIFSYHILPIFSYKHQ